MGPQFFPLYVGWGGTNPSIKSDQISTHQSLLHQIFILSPQSFTYSHPHPHHPTPPYVTWDIILIKTRIKKRSLKFSATKRSHFFIESWTFSACHNFTRSYNSWTSKSAADRKLLVLFHTEILEIPHAIGGRRGEVKLPIPADRPQWKTLCQELDCYCKPLEITVSICYFCWSRAICKNWTS